MALVPGDVAGRIPDRTVRRRLGAEDLVRYALVAVFALVLFLFVLYPMGQLAWRSLLDMWRSTRDSWTSPIIAASTGPEPSEARKSGI